MLTGKCTVKIKRVPGYRDRLPPYCSVNILSFTMRGDGEYEGWRIKRRVQEKWVRMRVPMFLYRGLHNKIQDHEDGRSMSWPACLTPYEYATFIMTWRLDDENDMLTFDDADFRLSMKVQKVLGKIRGRYMNRKRYKEIKRNL